MQQTAKNSQYTKIQNRLQLLRLLRQEPLSRATLARLTGLTRAAISLIVDELIIDGTIREAAPAPSTGVCGRTPILLTLCPDAYYAIGIHFSRSACRIGISDFTGGLIADTTICLSQSGSQVQQLSRLSEEVTLLLQGTNIPRKKILGVGIAAPGPVDAINGRILNPPDFDFWSNCDICSILGAMLDLPVYLENDANAVALFNYMENDFPEKENFLYLSVDSGVGSGVISGGTLLRSGGFTCELGHMSINFRGPLCSCGNRGCLERYASVDGLLKEFPEYSSLESLLTSSDADRALQLEAEYLSAAILSFTNILRVDAVLISGEFQNYMDRLIPLIQQDLHNKSLSLGKTSLVIAPALSGEKVLPLAACGIVFGRFLDIC